MKKYAKLICAVLVLALALGLGACGKPAEPKNALEKIKAEGVLTVALSPDFSPMEFVDSSKTGQDQYVGFDVTLAKYLADPGHELRCLPDRRLHRLCPHVHLRLFLD